MQERKPDGIQQIQENISAERAANTLTLFAATHAGFLEAADRHVVRNTILALGAGFFGREVITSAIYNVIHVASEIRDVGMCILHSQPWHPNYKVFPMTLQQCLNVRVPYLHFSIVDPLATYTNALITDPVGIAIATAGAIGCVYFGARAIRGVINAGRAFNYELHRGR